jgi:hypothetical protein
MRATLSVATRDPLKHLPIALAPTPGGPDKDGILTP